MDLVLTREEEELADKLLTQPYTFTQLHAGLSYTSDEFWGHIWENANYSLKQTIASSQAHPLPDTITVRKDDVHLLLKRQLTPKLLQKCLNVYPIEALSFSDVLLDLSTQLNLEEKTIRDIASRNPAFLTHMAYYGMGTILSDELTLRIIEKHPNSTILSLLHKSPHITPVILQEILIYLEREFQTGDVVALNTNLYTDNIIAIIPNKIDIDILSEKQARVLLNVLYLASEKEENCYAQAIKFSDKWLTVIDRYWQFRAVDTSAFPADYLAELAYSEFSEKDEHAK